MRLLLAFDAWLAGGRPIVLPLAQLALVTLGIHLASDRLDDYLGNALGAAPVRWSEPEWPLTAAMWVALVIEFTVIVWAGWTLLRCRRRPAANQIEAGVPVHVNHVLAALCWLPLALAGAWVVAMVVEDSLAGWLGGWPSALRTLAWVVASLALWRAGLSGWWTVTFRSPRVHGWSQGWPWVPAVVVVTGLAIRHGLPIWGWS